MLEQLVSTGGVADWQTMGTDPVIAPEKTRRDYKPRPFRGRITKSFRSRTGRDPRCQTKQVRGA